MDPNNQDAVIDSAGEWAPAETILEDQVDLASVNGGRNEQERVPSEVVAESTATRTPSPSLPDPPSTFLSGENHSAIATVADATISAQNQHNHAPENMQQGYNVPLVASASPVFGPSPQMHTSTLPFLYAFPGGPTQATVASASPAPTLHSFQYGQSPFSRGPRTPQMHSSTPPLSYALSGTPQHSYNYQYGPNPYKRGSQTSQIPSSAIPVSYSFSGPPRPRAASASPMRYGQSPLFGSPRHPRSNSYPASFPPAFPGSMQAITNAGPKVTDRKKSDDAFVANDPFVPRRRSNRELKRTFDDIETADSGNKMVPWTEPEVFWPSQSGQSPMLYMSPSQYPGPVTPQQTPFSNSQSPFSQAAFPAWGAPVTPQAYLQTPPTFSTPTTYPQSSHVRVPDTPSWHASRLPRRRSSSSSRPGSNSSPPYATEIPYPPTTPLPQQYYNSSSSVDLQRLTFHPAHALSPIAEAPSWAYSSPGESERPSEIHPSTSPSSPPVKFNADERQSDVEHPAEQLSNPRVASQQSASPAVAYPTEAAISDAPLEISPFPGESPEAHPSITEVPGLPSPSLLLGAPSPASPVPEETERISEPNSSTPEQSRPPSHVIPLYHAPGSPGADTRFPWHPYGSYQAGYSPPWTNAVPPYPPLYGYMPPAPDYPVIPISLRPVPHTPSVWSRMGRRFMRWPFSPQKRWSNVYEPYYTDFYSEDSYSKVAVKFLVVSSQLYLSFLLRIPAFYFSRVARIFKEADLTMKEIKEMALEAASKGKIHAWDFRHESQNVPEQFEKLKATWEFFIDSLMREWKTFNIISVLLLSAILTILQIDAAAEDPVTRYTALFSLICALISLLFGCLYIIRFGTMRKTYKAAEWAWEAKETKAVIWNVWVLLAMPAIWLTWSILLYIVCIMAFVWRLGSQDAQPSSLSPDGLLTIRIIITIVLGLGLLYGCLIIYTFRRYGEGMDRAWERRVDKWLQESLSVPSVYQPALYTPWNVDASTPYPRGFQPYEPGYQQSLLVHNMPPSESDLIPRMFKPEEEHTPATTPFIPPMFTPEEDDSPSSTPDSASMRLRSYAFEDDLIPRGFTPEEERSHGRSSTRPPFLEPEVFWRPFNAAKTLPPFEPIKIEVSSVIDEHELPKMPAVLTAHDILPEDWKRCMQDLVRTAQMSAPDMTDGRLPKRSQLVQARIEYWDVSFFLPRGVEMVLYQGSIKRRSGFQAGLVEDELIGDDNEYSSTPTTSNSDDADRAASPYRRPYGHSQPRYREDQKHPIDEKRRRRATGEFTVFVLYRSRELIEPESTREEHVDKWPNRFQGPEEQSASNHFSSSQSPASTPRRSLEIQIESPSRPPSSINIQLEDVDEGSLEREPLYSLATAASADDMI